MNTEEKIRSRQFELIQSLNTQRNRLTEALADVFTLIDGQWLVRNTERDAEHGFAMRQLAPTMKLANAKRVLDEAKRDYDHVSKETP